MVFFDNGGGDIYCGKSREQIEKQMLSESPEFDLSEMFEVSSVTPMRTEDGQATTLGEEAAEYGPEGPEEAFCIASENC